MPSISFMRSMFGRGFIFLLTLLMTGGIAHAQAKGKKKAATYKVEIQATIKAESDVADSYDYEPHGPDRPPTPIGTLTITGTGGSFTLGGSGVNGWRRSGSKWVATIRSSNRKVNRFCDYELTYRFKEKYHYFPTASNVLGARRHLTLPEDMPEVSSAEGSKVVWGPLEWELDGSVVRRGLLAFPGIKLKEVAWKNSEPIRQESAAKFGQPFPEPQWASKEKNKIESSPVCYAGEKAVLVSPKWEATGLGLERFKGNKIYLSIEGPGGMVYDDTEIAFPADGKLSFTDLELKRGSLDTGFEKRIKYYGIESRPADGRWTWKLKAKSSPTASATVLAEDHTDVQTYVILAPQPSTFSLYHTPLHIGCKNADGEEALDPAGIQRVVDLVWQEFTDRKVFRADGSGPMRYWGPSMKEGEGFIMQELLHDGNGRCGAWSHFFPYIFRSLRLPEGPDQVEICHKLKFPPAHKQYGFSVWPALLGQGDVIPSLAEWNDGHAVCYFNGNIYDPSYGAPLVPGANLQECGNIWEDAYVENYRHQYLIMGAWRLIAKPNQWFVHESVVSPIMIYSKMP